MVALEGTCSLIDSSFVDEVAVSFVSDLIRLSKRSSAVVDFGVTLDTGTLDISGVFDKELSETGEAGGEGVTGVAQSTATDGGDTGMPFAVDFTRESLHNQINLFLIIIVV